MKELLFSFEGRIGRKPFWLTMLAMVVVAIVVNVVVLGAAFAGAAAADPEAGGGGGGALGAVMMVVMLIFGVAALWIGLAVQAKRWHDQDKSAWWILINFIPAVGGLITLVMCGFLEGTSGPNRFGSAAV